MRIETASGHVILADDADAPLLNQYSWFAVKCGPTKLYAHARGHRTGKKVLMHRLLMSPPAGSVVHHRNNDGLDNRRANLEVTSQRQNARYRFEGKATGVHLYKQSRRWRAQVRDKAGRRVSLGIHLTREAAEQAVASYRSNEGSA